MDDERVVLRSALCLIDTAAGVCIQCVRAKAVDRLGRDAEQTAAADDLRRRLDIFICRFCKQDRFQNSASFFLGFQTSCWLCSFLA